MSLTVGRIVHKFRKPSGTNSGRRAKQSNLQQRVRRRFIDQCAPPPANTLELIVEVHKSSLNETVYSANARTKPDLADDLGGFVNVPIHIGMKAHLPT